MEVNLRGNILTVEDASASCSTNFPAKADLISTVTLSVSTIVITSSTLTESPTAFSHVAIDPSVILSPSAGTLMVTISKSARVEAIFLDIIFLEVHLATEIDTARIIFNAFFSLVIELINDERGDTKHIKHTKYSKIPNAYSL
jgi:hypothetical protein